MARPTRMSETELETAVATLDGWSLAAGKLHKVYRFADFVQAWGFMSKAALVAQAMDHHPEWSNVYSTVVVDLSTHDADGITDLDIRLARKMDALL